jgi:hypothetical protein
MRLPKDEALTSLGFGETLMTVGRIGANRR